MTTDQTNIKVIIRVRPYSRRELEHHNQRCIIKVMDETTLLFDPDEEDDEFFYQGQKQHHRDITKRTNKKLSMDFDRVYDTDTSNTQIFEECSAPLVDAVLDGYNCSVFVYGATGAGKTFTMLGNPNHPGLTYLTMSDLFDKIKAQSEMKKFDVGVSYLEVYNEQVMNLLNKSGPLKLREDSNGVIVSGLMLKPIFSAEQLLSLLALGNANRTQHPTDANAESSRSHAVFQVHIRTTDRETGVKRTVKLSMIDLAGSERAASTKGVGMRFKEGASINKSLLALGNCINKLADGLKHIPYRDSNLTRILKDSLGGNCRTLMVANVSMSSLTYEDTYNTLKYASRAKKIRTTLRQNVMKTNMPKEFYVKKLNELLAENERLKAANKNLESKMAERRAASLTKSPGYNANELKPWFNKIDAAYSSLMKIQEYVIGCQSKIKSLNFRTKLKEDAQAIEKIFVLDQGTAKSEQWDRCTDSAAHSEIEKHKEELPRWRRKLQDAYRDLEKIKTEIKGTKYADILLIYQKGKDLEVQSSKQSININHISGINSDFVSGMGMMRQRLTMACDLLQRSYESLSAADQLNSDLRDRYEQLHDFMIGDGSRRANEPKYDLKSNEMSAGNVKRKHSNNDEISSPSKRANNSETSIGKGFDITLDDIESVDPNDEESELSGHVFKMPVVRVENLNETRVISASTKSNDIADASNLSSSSSLFASVSSSQQKSKDIRKHLVSNILSDQVSRGPFNREHMKNVLLKSKNFSHQGLIKTVAAGVQKENKKHSPNRIRKSPRTVPTTTRGIPAPTHISKKSSLRAATNPTDGPIVRTNRAATFRVKPK